MLLLLPFCYDWPKLFGLGRLQQYGVAFQSKVDRYPARDAFVIASCVSMYYDSVMLD